MLYRKSRCCFVLASAMAIWPAAAGGQSKTPAAKFVEPVLLKSERPVASSAKVLSFQGITPGRSTRADVRASKGKPTQTLKRGKFVVWRYPVALYRALDVEFNKDRVAQLILRLTAPLTVDQAKTRLKLGQLRAAEIRSNKKVLGVVFPDRGVLFRFGQGDGQVTQIVVEPLTAGPFLLRVAQDRGHNHTRNLTDLTNAIQLRPKWSRTYAEKARLLMKIGRFGQADQAVNKAIRFSQGEQALKYRVWRADLLLQLDQVEKAKQDIGRALQATQSEVVARAQLLRGNVILRVRGDDREAMKWHRKAIQSAAGAAKSTDTNRSIAALQTLVEGHFAVARDIALGRWQGKTKAALRWASNAQQLAQRLFERTGDATVKLEAFVQTLEVMATLKDPQLDPGETIRITADLGKETSKESTDPLFRQRLVWHLACALGYAGEMEAHRKRLDRARQYLTNAMTLLDALKRDRPFTPVKRHRRGVECFLLGRVYAERGENREAILWFNQARIHFPKQPPKLVTHQLRFHGDRLVAMGVTYWKGGDRTMGLKLTREGTQHIEVAVKKNLAKPQALIIPYKNLAGMLRREGQETEADALTGRAAALERFVR